MTSSHKKVLWWGRSDVDYSRNRIVRQLFLLLGWELIDFYPIVSSLGHFEAFIRRFPRVDLVWVPCFRQRDVAAAYHWANKIKVPLIFDPLISAYDKQIGERQKFPETSKQAKKLLQWERSLFQLSDYIVADTEQHATFYSDMMRVSTDNISVLPVGAEESLFIPQEEGKVSSPLRILFYGSYISLQGPEVIAKAIQLYQGPEVEWTFIGDGPLRKEIEEKLQGLKNVYFFDWVAYSTLPKRIAQADICLGIFGVTEKTLRVIPNKVYQALASARPVITSDSNAYPQSLKSHPESGIFWVAPGDAKALANIIASLAENPEKVVANQRAAIRSYKQYFSNDILKADLLSILQKVGV